MKTLNLALILSLTVLASCGGSSKGSAPQGNAKGTYTNPLTTVDETFHGGKCYYHENFGVYAKDKLELATLENGESSVTMKFAFYDDKNCRNNLDLQIELPILSDYEKGDFNLEGDIDEVLYRPVSKRMVKGANKHYFCGKNDWELNVAKEVSYTSCREIYNDYRAFIELNPARTSASVTLCKKGQQPNGNCQTYVFKK